MMRSLSFAALLLLIFTCSFSFRKPPADGWSRLSKFDHQKDSFLLAPVSYFYAWDVEKNSSGIFYTLTHRALTAEDTIGYPRTAHILMDRTGDYPFQWMHDVIQVRKGNNDTLLLTISLGDGEWFADYVIRVNGKYHKGGCEPPNAQQAYNYRKDSVHFATNSEILQLDQKQYNTGDSIKGYVDCNFEMWSNPLGETPWKAHIRLSGTFKTIVK